MFAKTLQTGYDSNELKVCGSVLSCDGELLNHFFIWQWKKFPNRNMFLQSSIMNLNERVIKERF